MGIEKQNPLDAVKFQPLRSPKASKYRYILYVSIPQNVMFFRSCRTVLFVVLFF